MSSLKVRLFMALESFLRVPPLLIVDEIFRISFGIGNANSKYYPNGGILNLRAQRTRFIPDRENVELSESERLATNNFGNETVTETPNISTFASPHAQTLRTGALINIPILNEFWRVISDVLYDVFNPESPQQSPANSPGESISTATIVEEEVKGAPTVVPNAPQSDPFEFSTAQAAADLMKIAEILMYIILFFVAIITFMLATENLIKLYSHLVSFFAIYLSYIFTPFPALGLGALPSLLYNIVCRGIIAALFYACRSWPGGGVTFNPLGGGGTNPATVSVGVGGTGGEANNNNANYVELSSLTDCILLGTFFATGLLKLDPVLYVVLMIILHHPLLKCIPDVYSFLKSSWNETKRIQNEYGLSHLIQVESGRLRVNTVFRLFWITRAAYDAISKCCNEPLNSMIKYVMTHGTETFTGVVGLTVTVSAICHHIGEFILYLLYNGTNTEADANRFGSISTVLFFILSLQTGLTSLDPEKRLDRLAKNVVLLGTALFHALHQMISPVLTAFRAFQTLQIRAAVLSCSSFIGSAFLTYYLLRHATISTWSLAVLALAIEFKIKIFISLLISFVVYLSQLVQYPEALEKFISACRRILPTFVVRFFDHLHDELSHEDVVFYLRSVANVGEFLTGIFLFANAVWIFFFESASAIRAIGMSVHAYFNIWCEAQKGWRVYCQRKTASQKIMSLADATEEQLRSRQDDVCAVCYEEMESAKVTNCNHLFHAVCLRKWLYVQNTCPLCHEVLYREDALDTSDSEANTPPPPATPQPQQPLVEQPLGTDMLNVPVINTQPASIIPRFNNNNSSASMRTHHLSSDETDTDLDSQSPADTNNAPRSSDASSGVGRSAVFSATSSSTASSSVAGRSYRREPSESGNSSSGTEYTVDGSDEDDGLWAEDFSSSEEDNDDEHHHVRPRQNRGEGVIGVPLLL